MTLENLRSSRTVAVALVTFATFTDIVAYSIAVPVLPDLTRRLGASPTMIGLLFASFGVSVLALSLPMGALSDRMGRKTPLVLGLLALAASTVMFAFAERLPSLFAARLVQGAADAVTWVVGFALLADLFGPAERGRVMGFVMSGTTFGFMVGPTAGGWLYEAGGTEVPFLCVAACAVLAALGFIWLKIPSKHTDHTPVPVSAILRVPAVAVCSAAVVVRKASSALAAGSVDHVAPSLSAILALLGESVSGSVETLGNKLLEPPKVAVVDVARCEVRHRVVQILGARTPASASRGENFRDLVKC